MISMKKIFTVSFFEAKTLVRSWFFRIFSLLVIAILVLLNIVLFTIPQASWMNRGLGASIPYMNLFLMNIAQAIIAVFMASEFLKFDYKLDTTEAIYVRSMTNADYILGKALGVLSVFIILNMAVLVLSFIFNFFFTEVTVIPIVYFYYPLLISLPTLIFIFGLSFLIMVTIRNQAVTFIILLGYIASTIFFLSGRFNHIFDYMANSLPLMYSEMTGFGNLTDILIHRAIYLSIGLGCIFATVLFLRRLSQSKMMSRISAFLALLFIFGGIFLATIYIQRINSGKELRTQIKNLNRELSEKPCVTLTSNRISLIHKGNIIEASASLTFSNNTETSIDDYWFSLNPDLSVVSVTRGGENIQFERNLHIITLKPQSPLSPGAEDSLTISYRGTINEDAAYPDIDEDTRNAGFRFWVYNVEKHYGFITPEYVLLTSENQWYPIAGLPYGSLYPELKTKDFINFELQVKTSEGLSAVSQGMIANPSAGVFEFKPEAALPKLSLAIGKYKKMSIIAEGIEYNIYVTEGHDYFSKYFKNLQEKLPELIDNQMAELERKMDISYPYSRLSLIEVPIQFYSYPRIWTSAQEIIQPEQVFLPEKGVLLRGADFKLSSYFMSRGGFGGPGGGGGGRGGGGRGGGSGGGQTMTDEEIQSNLFNRFVQSTFTQDNSNMRNFRRNIGALTSGNNISIQRLAFTIGMGSMTTFDYNLFPQFYTFVNHISSERWPVLNMAMENFLKTRATQTSFRPPFMGTSNEDVANTALQKQSFHEILDDSSKEDILQDVLSSKGNYLFSLIQSRIGTDEFNSFLSGFLYENNFRDMRADEFLNALNSKFSVDLTPYLDDWYSQQNLPAFIFGEMKCYEIIDSDKTRYQVIFTVSNPEPVEGLISFNFMLGGSRGERQMGFGAGGFGGGSTGGVIKYVNLKGNETKEIGILLDAAPRTVIVNTFISQNLPSSFNKNFGKPETGQNISFFEGERVLPKPLSLSESGEVIVDDEDPGFSNISNVNDTFLKKLFEQNGSETSEYIPLMFWRPPLNWRHTVQGDFYGVYRHSAYFIKSGDGSKKAIWKAEIPEKGNYNIYCYKTPVRNIRRGGRPGQQQQPEQEADYHYFVHHDDGVEEIVFENSSAPEGWNLLGTFYLSAGTTEVELTNKSESPIVIADAIKWVKQRESGSPK